jgi:hypothetical protein
MIPITLDSPLTIRNAFCYPIQSSESRRDVLIGALWLFVPGVGWVMNMGHRIVATHNALNGKEPWPAWGTPGILRHGLVTLLGMIVYHAPATFVGVLAREFDSQLLWGVAGVLWLLATCLVPGYMTRYCVSFDIREIFDIRQSVVSVINSRAAYWYAWVIVLLLLCASFLGLVGFGVVFFLTSVWFWQSAAFCFASTMKKGLQVIQQ